MREKIKELKSIIYQYDELLGCWFDGYRPIDIESEDVYITSDKLRNRAIEILVELEENKND